MQVLMPYIRMSGAKILCRHTAGSTRREAAPRIRPDTAVAGLLLQREKPGIYTPAGPRRVALPAGRMGNITTNTVRGNNHL